MLLKRCVLLAHRIASYYHFFCPAGFPHSAHCIFQFPHTFDLFPSTLHFSSFSFQYSGAGLFDNLVCILECRIFRNYRTDLQKIEGKSRNHLFSHTGLGGWHCGVTYPWCDSVGNSNLLRIFETDWGNSCYTLPNWRGQGREQRGLVVVLGGGCGGLGSELGGARGLGGG